MRFQQTDKNQFLGFKPLEVDENGLPLKTSLFLRWVVEDIAKINAANNIHWNMELWLHKSLEDDSCMVCLAGAVFIQRIGMPPHSIANGDTLPSRITNLDTLRKGWIFSFLKYELKETGNDLQNIGDIIMNKFYKNARWDECDPKKLSRQITFVADELEAAGY